MKCFSKSWLQKKPLRIVLVYVCFAMLWIAVSDWLLQLVGNTRLYAQLSSLKGLLFIATTAALLYLLLKRDNEPQADTRPSSPLLAKRKLLAALAGLVLIVPLIGLGIVLIHGPNIQQQAYATLEAIRDLKAEQLDGWLKERHRQAEALAASPALARHISQLLDGPAPIRRAQLNELLMPLNALFQYSDIALFDPQLRTVVGFNDPTLVTPELLQSLLAVQRSRQAQPYTRYDSDTARHQRFWQIPITLTGSEGHPRIAVLLMHIELESQLTAVMQHWPMASPSGQLLLLHRDGDRISYLGRARHEALAILPGQQPLAATDIAAAAVRSAQTGIVEGIDHLGVRVLAAYRPIAESDWYLLAKLDREEVMAPLWDLVFWVSLVTLTATATVSIMLLLLWRQTLKAQHFELQAKSDEQNRLLMKFYELPFVGMAITSPETKQSLHSNDRLCEMLGYSRSELQSISWLELTHPDDLAADLAEFERLLKGETRGYSIDKRIFRKDGSLGYVSIDVKGVYREDDTLEYLVTTLEDITERTLLEQALSRREQEYRQLFTANPLPMWVHARQSGRFLAVNAAAIDCYGYSREAFLSMHLEDLEPTSMPPDSPQPDRSADDAGLVRHQTRSGMQIDVELLSHPIEFSGTAAELVLANDVTQKRQHEQDLRLAATVFENTREGILITDPQTRIIKVNQALCAMFGYQEAELLGQTPALFKSGRHDRRFFDAIWQTIEDTGHWQGEIWSRRKNGEIFPELNSISAVHDQHGMLTHYVGIIADISRLKASEAELEFLAHHDSLTQLPNRRLLFSRLEHSLKQAHRQHHQLALLMLDLDRFKDVNDSFGHLAGDELLQQVATRLASLLRASDTLVRLGGDEFVLLLEQLAAPEDAAHLADRIIATLNHSLTLTNGVEIRTGASIGIALFPDHGQTPEQLLQQADTALYHAKEQGRGRFSYYTNELTATARQRLDLEARLRCACSENQLLVQYQPQLDINTGAINAAEALVRWQDPERGLILPGEFIPVAEHTGLIDLVGHWVLRETCRQGREWLDAGFAPLSLSVNLSAAQLRHGDIAATVERVLEETGYPASNLTLELTESALMTDEQNVLHILNRLRILGIRLAIDDFGTGYSSLAYLRHFPIDMLKIDKSFVDDIEHNSGAREIAATIIAMGHTLGLKVLAEGVETAEQLSLLQTLGCDYYQGYLKSRSLPAAQFSAILASRP